MKQELWLTEQDGSGYSNGYIYCANSDTIIMAGSLPVIRFAKRRAMLGTLRFFDQAGSPLDEKTGITARTVAGLSGWDVGGTHILVGAPRDTHAAVVRLQSKSPVTVQFGGVHFAGEDHWTVCPDYEGNYRTVAFDRAQLGESYTPVEGGFWVRRGQVDEYLARRMGEQVKLMLTASFPLRIQNGMAVGVCEGEGYLGLFLCKQGQQPMPLARAFASAESRAEELSARLQVNTPEKLLNAACAYVANHQDGIWYPPKLMHSSVSWNGPFLGWTNRYGNDILGWHDRTYTELAYYSATQNKEDNLTGAPQDPAEHRGMMPHSTSRFYGKGHMEEDQQFYNMQTLYFDQAIHSWRMTGDPALQKLLRPMLELHCQWLDDCFDRGGIYESEIDTWPTDTVWNDGGGAPETTSFAYRAHCAAADMARLEGDTPAARRHEQTAQKINAAFHEKLWSNRLGVAGRCYEQGTDRLAENPWSYSVFLPIETGLLTDIEAAQSLYYSEWAYQNDTTPGGRVITHSNWLPMVWSVRPRGGSEQFMLARAYFRAGLPEQAMQLMMGLLGPQKADKGSGGLIKGHANLGSDGARAVLEGLFGYLPDYPNGRVTVNPSVPLDWQDASVRTADVSIVYHKEPGKTRLELTLTQPAAVTFELFLSAEKLTGVTGAALTGLKPAFGRTKAVLQAEKAAHFCVELTTAGDRSALLPTKLTAAPGQQVLLPGTDKDAKLLDPQYAADSLTVEGQGVTVTAAQNSGQHWLAALLPGELPVYRVYHLQVLPTQTEKELARRQLRGVAPEQALALNRPAQYTPVDLSGLLNCDVQKIYKQQYLSPRPETVSVRLGVDGYSAWTMDFWENQVPEITLEQRGTVYAADGVPLQLADGQQNIAFVSRWDNFPTRLTVPVGQQAKAAVVLLCGTTNPMQCGVENLRLTFRYTDGSEESLPLRNPDEFWSLCPLYAGPSSADQVDSNECDYNYETAAFCLPQQKPDTLQLGKNCRAVAVRWQLDGAKTLQEIGIAAVAKEVVIGVMAVTLID